MLIYDTFATARSDEPELLLLEDGTFASANQFERDWGYRLRGTGLPGGEIGWLLTFSGVGSGFGADGVGFLIAYEISHNTKTGRVGVLRREWDGKTDDAERNRITQTTSIWNAQGHHHVGEADIDVVDAAVLGTRI